MKLKFILLLSGLLFTISAFAQKPSYGIKLGFNTAKWGIGEPTVTFKNKFRVGLVSGVNVDLPVSGQVTLQSELLYSMFGSTFSKNSEYAKYKVNYLLLPVMAKYNLENGLSLLAGPQFGLLMSAKSNIDGDQYDFKDDMKKTDMFFVIGADYKLQNGIVLGFRYQHGLTNTETDADVNFIKNRAFSMTATYKLKHSFSETLNSIFK